MSDKNSSASTAASTGISLGSAIAVAISYTAHQSVGWAILHGFLSWFYVIYALLTDTASF
ncbi:MAG: hypothetical protein ACNS61_16440 [Candidatus Wenzhouxiangella sp. M2_3B_020]